MLVLKFQTWYSAIWLAVVALYCLGWSSLNSELSAPLLAFLFTSILVSGFIAAASPKVPVIRLEWCGKRRPVITLGIAFGFVADWAYSRRVPILTEYQGSTGVVDVDMTVGIPVFHVAISALAVFYAMYVSYLFLSDPKRKDYLAEYLLLLVFLFLNNSRGYIAFCLIVFLLLYVAFTNKGIRNTRVLSVIATILLGLFVIFFISAMGNVRSGYSWNDCSYIERIGRYTNYPSGLSKHFMWAYTYATSPLANLSLNVSTYAEASNPLAALLSFVPESFSKWYTSGAIHPVYYVSYLNAATAFTPFACSLGMMGVWLAFVVLLAYYSFVAYLLKRQKVLETFGNAALSFCVMATVFFNVFTTSVICYIPLFLLIASFWLRRKAGEGFVRFAPVDNSSKLGAKHAQR